MKNKYLQSIATIGVIMALLVVINMVSNTTNKALGSVSVTDEYRATSTASSGIYGAFTGDNFVKTGQGTLGSVVITGANTGIVNIYNATTSNVNLRTGNKASSTIHLASFPANTAAQTYTFDVGFTDGLFIDLESGLMPTTTITYRNN